MKWYLKVVRDNYANFEGRARRQEYWMFTLINVLIIIVLAVISGGLVAASEEPAFMSLYLIYALGVFIPGLAVSVRRLHDTGKSGWYYLVSLIPLIGGIWLIILMATEGDVGPNEYGEDPKSQRYHPMTKNEKTRTLLVNISISEINKTKEKVLIAQ